MAGIARLVAAVQDKVARAAAASGRPAEAITLVAVTKTWPVDTLLEGYAAGLRHFGENRAAELAEKRPPFEEEMGEIPVTWHFIGHLQSRQSQTVADLADVFHAADRPKILSRLGRQLAANGRRLDVLLEVNVSGEASKSGFAADRWEADAAQSRALLSALRLVQEIPALNCRGLMTMAPWQVEPAVLRDVFCRTRRLRDFLEKEFGLPLPELSMGMTDDFEIAIEEGATLIRVGRALFGERPV